MANNSNTAIAAVFAGLDRPGRLPAIGALL